MSRETELHEEGYQRALQRSAEREMRLQKCVNAVDDSCDIDFDVLWISESYMTSTKELQNLRDDLIRVVEEWGRR